MGSKRHIVKVFYKYSDQTVDTVDSVTVINLNFNWLTNAFENLRQLVKKTIDKNSKNQ